MPAESFGEVEKEEKEEEAELYSEPVYYTEPLHVYVSCEHIYEAIAEEEEEEEAAMESESSAALKLFSEAEDATLRMRRATVSRRVSRRRSFVLERECPSSEGGRFVSRLLNECEWPMIGLGPQRKRSYLRNMAHADCPDSREGP